MSKNDTPGYAATSGGDSNVYFFKGTGSKRISVGIEGPRGGQGSVAFVPVDDLLDALITAVGPLAITTAIAKHKGKRVRERVPRSLRYCPECDKMVEPLEDDPGNSPPECPECGEYIWG